MKRFLPVFLVSFFFLFAFLFFTRSALALSDPDQYLVNGTNGYWRIKSHELVGQTFKPSKNRLDAVNVFLSGNEVVAKVTLEVWDSTSKITDQMKAKSIVPSWLLFDFADVVVTPGDTYTIYLKTQEPDLYWRVKTTGGYGNGYAIIDSSPLTSQDFGFVTYGYDVAPPPEEPPSEPPGSQPPSSNGDDTTTDTTDTTSDTLTGEKTPDELVLEEKEATPPAGLETKINTPSATPSAEKASEKGFFSKLFDTLRNPFVSIPIVILLLALAVGIIWWIKKRQKGPKPGSVDVEKPKEDPPEKSEKEPEPVEGEVVDEGKKDKT